MPLRLTVCVLPAVPLLLSVTVRVPVSAPPVVGAKVTLIVQDEPAPTVAPQVLDTPKLGVAEMLATASGALPVLLSVTGCDALVEFTA